MFLPPASPVFHCLGVHPTVGRQMWARRGGEIGVRVGGSSLECPQGGSHLHKDQRKVGPGAFLDLCAWGGNSPWRNYFLECIPCRIPGDPAGQNSLWAKEPHLRQLWSLWAGEQTCAPPRRNTWNYLKSPLSLPPTPACTPGGYHTFASVPQDVFLFGVGVGLKA